MMVQFPSSQRDYSQVISEFCLKYSRDKNEKIASPERAQWTRLKLEGEEVNGITCEELNCWCCPLSLLFPIFTLKKAASASSSFATVFASSINFFLCNFSSASLRNLNCGGGEDHVLMNSSSHEYSNIGVRGGAKKGGEARGVKNGVLEATNKSLKLLPLDPILLLPSSDSNSSLVSSLMVKRNLGRPCSLISSASTVSSSSSIGFSGLEISCVLMAAELMEDGFLQQKRGRKRSSAEQLL